MEDRAFVDALHSHGEPREIKGAIPYVLVPTDAEIKDLEHLLPKPLRARAAIVAHDVSTLIAYVNRFKRGDTVLFADPQAFTVVGIIDYHGKDAPAFREHRVTFTAPRSLEWQAWRGHSGKRMSQADFAQFIEDHVMDITDPKGAQVLEVARSLQAKRSVEFASAIKLQDGSQQFTYNETTNGTSSKGNLKIPDRFKLGIPVFFGGDAYDVTALLRYRIDEGKLSLWYDLYRAEYVEQDAFKGTIDAAAKGTSIEMWMGKP